MSINDINGDIIIVKKQNYFSIFFCTLSGHHSLEYSSKHLFLTCTKVKSYRFGATFRKSMLILQ